MKEGQKVLVLEEDHTYTNKVATIVRVCIDGTLSIKIPNDSCRWVDADKVKLIEEPIKESVKSKELQYRELLEDILNHIESGLISLESSGYLLGQIEEVLE